MKEITWRDIKGLFCAGACGLTVADTLMSTWRGEIYCVTCAVLVQIGLVGKEENNDR